LAQVFEVFQHLQLKFLAAFDQHGFEFIVLGLWNAFLIWIGLTMSFARMWSTRPVRLVASENWPLQVFHLGQGWRISIHSNSPCSFSDTTLPWKLALT
jgi:hypothetical protein